MINWFIITKNQWHELWSKKNVFIIIITTLVIIGNFGFLLRTVKPQSDPMYLHYNIYFGVDLIGIWYQLYLIPSLGLIILIVNTGIALLINKRFKTLATMIFTSSAIFAVILFWASFLIYRQNI